MSSSGGLDGTWKYYYNGQQMIEAVDGSDNLLVQTYHGTQYIDEVVSMKTDYGYMVVHQDANWNVVATTDLGASVLEVVFYSPYGELRFNSETFFGDYDADGDVDATDDGNLGEGQTCWGASPSGACRVFDFDQDGDLDSADQTVMTSLVNLASTNHAHNNRTYSPAGVIFAHQGLIWDPEIQEYQNRSRAYSPALMRFTQWDPLGYNDALNLYTYAQANPVRILDPSGEGPLEQLRGVTGNLPRLFINGFTNLCIPYEPSTQCSGPQLFNGPGQSCENVTMPCTVALPNLCQSGIDGIPGVSDGFKKCMKGRCGCGGSSHVRARISCDDPGSCGPCDSGNGEIGCNLGEPKIWYCQDGGDFCLCILIIFHEMARSCGEVSHDRATEIGNHFSALRGCAAIQGAHCWCIRGSFGEI